jgi:hypothetical protein
MGIVVESEILASPEGGNNEDELVEFGMARSQSCGAPHDVTVSKVEIL